MVFVARIFIGCAYTGAQVVLSGHITKEGESVAKDIQSKGGDAVFHTADVTKDADIEVTLPWVSSRQTVNMKFTPIL